MTKNTLMQCVVIFACLLVLIMLSSTGFFVSEERFQSQPTAYIEGATPPQILDWKMY